jgi:hypothetical protein
MNQGRSESVNTKNLTNIFKKLWEQNIMWTRSFIISTALSLGDLQPFTKRLLQNPGDFANEFRQFYGDEKAKNFAKLLTEYLLSAVKLVNDAKDGNKNAVEIDRKNWHQDADEIAGFLASTNPNWNKRDWQTLLYNLIKMTDIETTYRLTSQYTADVAQYDNIENEALKVADYMADGIKKQFPTA